MRLHSVYRMFDADGALLYAGCTSRLPQRIDEQQTNPWWSDTVSITVEHFESVREALNAERRVIETERPRYNKMFNKAPLRLLNLSDRRGAPYMRMARGDA